MSFFKTLRLRWLVRCHDRTAVLMERERALHNMHMSQLRAERDALALRIARRFEEATR
ncbi:hypothetical protein [Paracidovorax citrulli]|uniref:hypothetical protein n=1 Tax=Paracidovorax citrulli TaxID=80869 RepID=UPI000312BEFF|nr:hypothetical protein [Paracidovorax citrulli]